jgi:glycopeptide antibiotics resistance protein
MKTFLFLLSLVLVTGIFYFSWLPDSELTSESYLPIWVLNWSNEYVNIRTAIPFFVLGLVLQTKSGTLNPINKNSWIYNILGATAIVVIAEIGQYFTDERHTDILDVFFGIFGTLSGIVTYIIIIKLVKKFINEK